MSESLFSPYWYRAASLHPRLVSSVAISRQSFRDEIWYILTSGTGKRQFRVNALGYQVVGRLDGRKSIQEIWDTLVRQMGTDVPSQHEVLSILSELNAAGMLHSEYAADLGGMFTVADRRRRTSNPLNPIALRVPLFDPTRLLKVLGPTLGKLFQTWLLWLWLAVVTAGIVLTVLNWPGISNYASIHSLSPRNLLLMWLIYPIIKLIHELAHALAIHHFHGEVHEVGTTLFLLIPIPYVDASAATSFPNKYHRMLVSAMGVIAETSVAVIALAIWLLVSDGWVRDIAFCCMLIGGMSTVLINANPLTRYDGYYVLCDWLELPNVGARADAWMRYLGERWLLGNAGLSRPQGTDNLRGGLFFYSLASLIYRVMLYAGMVIWLLAKQIVLGCALMLWMLWSYAVSPAWRVTQLVWSSPRLERHRTRALVGLALGASVLIAAIFLIPLPYNTRAEGIVWVPEKAVVRNEAAGFVEEVFVQDNAPVVIGQPLLRLVNSELISERKQAAARISSTTIAFNMALMEQPGVAVALQEEREKLQRRLDELDTRLAQLTILSPVAGLVAMPRSQDLLGQFLPRGTTVAHIVAPDHVVVRALLTQADVNTLSTKPVNIDVRMAEDRLHSMKATIGQGAPAASFQLPSTVLGDRAGGSIVTDPSDPQGLRTLESFFVLDLNVQNTRLQRIGSRAWIKFQLEPEPLFLQWSRRIRQLFVKQLGNNPGTLPAPIP